MDLKLPCDKREEQIKALVKRVDGMEDMRGFVHSIDKNMGIQTIMLEHIVEHNIRQDKRMNNQEDRMEKQDEVMVQMSESLMDLNSEVKYVKEEVEIVKTVQDGNEEKHLVDLRIIEKKRYVETLFRYVLPISGAGVIIWEIIRIIKG